MFHWKSDLTGTGSRSFKCDIAVDWIRLEFFILNVDVEMHGGTLHLRPFLALNWVELRLITAVL